MKKDYQYYIEQNQISEAQFRARSITVGTAFGGTVEISMRRPDGTPTFVIMQPVEAIELIHQLAACSGCHIHLTPRKDFASWRNWDYSKEELDYYRGMQNLQGVGHPPHTALPDPEHQPGFPTSALNKQLQTGDPK